jgi:hypothetical protein
MFTGLLFLFLAATPTLAGHVSDSRGKPLSGAVVQIQVEGGRLTELVTDSRGVFRTEISGKFHLEIRHNGYRTVRSSTVSLNGGSDDSYQVGDIQLLPGNPDDVETVVLQLEEVANPEARSDPTIREALPKSDRLFGLRGGVNVTNIREGSA